MNTIIYISSSIQYARTYEHPDICLQDMQYKYLYIFKYNRYTYVLAHLVIAQREIIGRTSLIEWKQIVTR